MYKDNDYVLTYGKSFGENKERFPKIKSSQYRNLSMIMLDLLMITEYTLDCGSALFHHCSKVSDDTIKEAIDFCSFNGFDKIFHTHTNPNQQRYDAFKDRMISLGFNYIPAGHSNRNPEYLCGIFVYYIPDCEHKGYTF